MGYSLEIEIPLLPPTANTQGSHNWKAQAFIRKKFRDGVTLWLKTVSKPKVPLPYATIHFTRCSSRQPDFDGLVHSFKPVQDALKQAGIIEDDSPKHIGYPSYSWEKAPQKFGKIKIRVVERAALEA